MHRAIRGAKGGGRPPCAVLCLATLVLLGACNPRKERSSADAPANEIINNETRKRIDSIQEMMRRGENTTVRCAGARTYAEFLSADKSAGSVALVLEVKKLCEHDAPIAFAKATLRKTDPQGRLSPKDCAAVDTAFVDIATEYKDSAEAREISAKYKTLCK